MVPLPNLSTSLQSTATGRAENTFAGAAQGYGSGAWVVNLGGSGAADFDANASAAGLPAGAVGGLPLWAWIIGAAAVLWALK